MDEYGRCAILINKINDMIEITSREKEAIQNVLDMYVADEYRDCERWLIDEYGASSDQIYPDENTDGDHVYYDLRILQQLLNRINTEK